MLDIRQLRQMVVQPALAIIGRHSPDAEALVLGTAMQESNLKYLRQLGAGPALGLFQMEPATHDDIWDNYLTFRNSLAAAVNSVRAEGYGAGELAWNLMYAAAMCRVHYLRVPDQLPDRLDADAMGVYWKEHYNTALGKGTPHEFSEKYQKHVLPLYS